MKSYVLTLTNTFPAVATFHLTMLLFRTAVSVQLMLAHGLKKIGVGVASAEAVPNPLHLPEWFNQGFAIASNLVFPTFILAGLFTRLSTLGVLAVTLTGYFIVHRHDTLLEKDMPFMYSVACLLILALGAGRYSLDFIINRRILRKSWPQSQ